MTREPRPSEIDTWQHIVTSSEEQWNLTTGWSLSHRPEQRCPVIVGGGVQQLAVSPFYFVGCSVITSSGRNGLFKELLLFE